MRIKRYSFKLKHKLTLFLAIALFGLGACTSVDEEKKTNEKKTEESNPSLVTFNGKLFNVPSPFQIALLVQQTKIPYNGSILNATENLPNYVNEFDKAIALGVYGADLGYLTVYDQLPEAAKYFSVVKKLTDELRMGNAIPAELLERIEKNMNNKDSLLYLVALSYRNADSYLINNERNKASTCILAGAWVESLYVLSQIATSGANKEILDRIGEQKYTLENILSLLRPNFGKGDADFDHLSEKLVDLATVFDGVTIEYSYNPPITDAQNKTTVITSSTKTVISDYQLKTIREMTEDIRKTLIK